jgi:hypothetical protein
VVAVLPQASTAVNVLVCDLEQPAELILPSEEVILVTGPQASVADAEPSAALISEAKGLQPSVVADPLAVIVGGTWSLVQLTVLTAVAELPQPSTAVNVLICDEVQLVFCTVPSEEVIVTGPQASVADAEPRAAVISDAKGLHPSVTLV